MPFSEEIKRKAMVECGRHCCICHKFCGNNMEVHHITPHAQGGADTFENAIPLCFDCHAEVGQYNPDHPKGIKFSEKELIEHRNNWYNLVKKNGGKAAPKSESVVEPIKIYRQKDFENIKLHKVNSGRELLNYISNSCAMDYGNDEPRTREEAELIGDFFQTINEILDAHDLYDPKDHVILGFELNETIDEMEQAGFWIFAEKEVRQIRGGYGMPDTFPVLIIRLIRKNNPYISYSGEYGEHNNE